MYSTINNKLTFEFDRSPHNSIRDVSNTDGHGIVHETSEVEKKYSFMISRDVLYIDIQLNPVVQVFGTKPAFSDVLNKVSQWNKFITEDIYLLFLLFRCVFNRLYVLREEETGKRYNRRV